MPKPTVLRLDSTGPDVLRVQRRLAANGYGVPQSGIYDTLTAEAVEEFQTSHLDKRGRPLGVDGEIAVGGAATWWALHHPSKRAQAQAGAPTTAKQALMALPVNLVGDRLAVLRVACAEIGAREQPDGSNGGPRVDVYTDRWRAPWCAMFVSWCIREALHQDAFSPYRQLASVTKIAAWGRSTGRLVREPQQPVLASPAVFAGRPNADPMSGNVFLMLTAGGDGVDAGRGHTGFVLAVEQDTILTVAGNEGNAVRCKRRPRSTIAGYVRLA